MKNQSQTRQNLEVYNPVADTDGQKQWATRYDILKEKQKAERERWGMLNGDTGELPGQQENTISEQDKMLLDYALLTSLY